MYIREVTLTGSSSQFEYLHTDHLGSVEVITDGAGVEITRNQFDPFGYRRNAEWSGIGSAQSMDFQNVHTNRGFTGHEQLDSTGLIHMNGRVYDPSIGRFMSADPFVQAPSFSQSYNRYAYVWNNPLGATDPSGYAKTLCEATSCIDPNSWEGQEFLAALLEQQRAAEFAAASAMYREEDFGFGTNGGNGADNDYGSVSYLNDFGRVWNERVDQITGAADNAVEYYIDQGGAFGLVGGTLAGTLTRNNIVNTSVTLGTGGVGGAAVGIGRQAYVNSVRSLSGLAQKLASQGYSQRAIARTMVRGRNLIKDYFRGPLKNLMKNYHRPTSQQLLSTKSADGVISGATRTNSGVDWMLGAW